MLLLLLLSPADTGGCALHDSRFSAASADSRVPPSVETSPVGYGFLARNARSDIFKLNFLLHQLATPAASRSHAASPFISNDPNAYDDSQLLGINCSVADQAARFATFHLHLQFSSLPPGRPPEWLWLLSQYLIDIYNELALSLAFDDGCHNLSVGAFLHALGTFLLSTNVPLAMAVGSTPKNWSTRRRAGRLWWGKARPRGPSAPRRVSLLSTPVGTYLSLLNARRCARPGNGPIPHLELCCFHAGGSGTGGAGGSASDSGTGGAGDSGTGGAGGSAGDSGSGGAGGSGTGADAHARALADPAYVVAAAASAAAAAAAAVAATIRENAAAYAAAATAAQAADDAYIGRHVEACLNCLQMGLKLAEANGLVSCVRVFAVRYHMCCE